MLLLARIWPDSLDLAATLTFLGAVFLLPLAGYYFMVVDIRAYLRALRRALVRVTFVFSELPEWARYETPSALRALGLRMPATEADVRRAYHRLAERLHPDRGGNRRRFLALHRDFQAALAFVRQYEAERRERVFDPARA